MLFRVGAGKAITILYIAPVALETKIKSPYKTYMATGSTRICVGLVSFMMKMDRYSLNSLYHKPSKVKRNLINP